MSHHVAHACLVHKAIQRQCRCPEPITSIVWEGCRHGALTERSLFWSVTEKKIVRGHPDNKPESPFDKAAKDIKRAIILGIDVESNDPAWDPAVGQLTERQVNWIARWLASEGFTRKQVDDSDDYLKYRRRAQDAEDRDHNAYMLAARLCVTGDPLDSDYDELQPYIDAYKDTQ